MQGGGSRRAGCTGVWLEGYVGMLGVEESHHLDLGQGFHCFAQCKEGFVFFGAFAHFCRKR